MVLALKRTSGLKYGNLYVPSLEINDPPYQGPCAVLPPLRPRLGCLHLGQKPPDDLQTINIIFYVSPSTSAVDQYQYFTMVSRGLSF